MKYKLLGVPRKMFHAVLLNSYVFHSDHFTLRLSKNTLDDGSVSRVSFVVSAKVAKKAVTRNLIKRRGRAIVRDALKTSPKPMVGIFYVKKGVDTMSFLEMKSEVKFLFDKAFSYKLKARS